MSIDIFLPNFLVTHDAANDATRAAKNREVSHYQIYNTDWLIHPKPLYDIPMEKTFARREP
jgi:hypothetical protein